MQEVKILSDYTPLAQPNYLRIVADDQGDYHISIVETNDDNTGVTIAVSGTRHSDKIRKALQALVDAYEEELNEFHHYETRELNELP